jgi:hypothetical protein
MGWGDSHQVEPVAVWDHDQWEQWLLVSNLTGAQKARKIYAECFWVEEMRSDHKSRGLNLCFLPPLFSGCFMTMEST